MRAPLALVLALTHALPLALVTAAAAPARAEPAAPFAGPGVAQLDWGVFCGNEAMDRAPAPGTDSGFIHVPRRALAFHWPGLRRVPAALGLAFGVEALAAPGQPRPVEIRVFHPGRDRPETWATDLADLGASLVFFRFDTADELIPGLWVIAAHDIGAAADAPPLFRVEFQVVPAGDLPEMVLACEATA